MAGVLEGKDKPAALRSLYGEGRLIADPLPESLPESLAQVFAAPR